MEPDQRKRSGSVAWAVALHVAIAAALTLGIRWPSFRPAAPASAPIQGVIIDQKEINRAAEAREREQRVERERKERQEQQVRDAAEQKRKAEAQKQREKEEAVKKEQERVAADQRKKEEAAREQREKEAAAKKEQERIAQMKADQEKRDREEAARKKREAELAAKQRAQAEADLQAQVDAESKRNADLLDQYIRLLQNHIERNWVAPPTAKVGLDCVVNVVQIPSGDVIDARVGRCNGDEAVVRSIEIAVRKASPLPKPPDPRLFQRNLEVHFNPQF
jgi:colicin import membrane protein